MEQLQIRTPPKVGDYISGQARKTGENEYEVVQITKFGPEAKATDGKKAEATQEKKAAAKSDYSVAHALARDHPQAKAPKSTPTPSVDENRVPKGN